MNEDTLSGLRAELFAELRALRTSETPNIARARAVSELAGVLIESARVEVDAARLNKCLPGSGFVALAHPDGSDSADGLPQSGRLTHANGNTTTVALLAPGVTRVTHRAK